MTIAITINTSWNIYNFRLGLIKVLLADGHRVVAIAPADDFSNKLIAGGCEFEPVKIANTGSNPLTDLKLIFDLFRIYRRVKPDIVFQYTIKPNLFGTIAAKLNGTSVINNVSGLGTVFLTDGISSKIAKTLYRHVFKLADLVFFQNPDDEKEFRSQIVIPNLKSDLLPGSGINLLEFQSKTPMIHEPIKFIMVARLIVEKGINEYLQAAALVKASYPDTVIQILGKLDATHSRGMDKNLLQDSVDKGIVEYLGEQDDVRPLLEKASCVVLPSYREGTPRTLLEAAAMRKPIITTDVPGCREVVEDQVSGFLCEVRNASDLANKMMLFMKLPHEQKNEMGDCGRKLVEDRFDEKIVIDKYIKHSALITNQISY